MDDASVLLAAVDNYKDEIKRLRSALEFLLENDELTQYGRKTAQEALADA